jgi:hypothetical protein
VIQVRPISKATELDSIYRLTYDAYRAMEYCEDMPDKRLIHYRELDVDRRTIILGAYDGERMVGTCSTTRDGLAGLHCERDFPDMVRHVRAEGRRLGSCWRIATLPEARTGTRVVLRLIRETVKLWQAQAMETILMTFNPHHEDAYRKSIGAKTIEYGNAHIAPGHEAPAVLMRWDAEME